MTLRYTRWTWALAAIVCLFAAVWLSAPGRSQRGGSGLRAAAAARCDGTFSDGSRINIASPVLLADVPGDQIFCDFHTFAWNQFVYLTRMAADPNNGGQVTPMFLHLAPWYNMLPQSGGAAPGTYPGGGTALLAGPMDKRQAGDQDILMDVNGKAVLYDIRFNDSMYASVVGQKLYNAALFDAACKQGGTGNCANPLYLPATGLAPGGAGSMEIKTAWRDFGAPGGCPANFYCNGRFGLVGMHIVQKTPTHGEWIWASFEHKANDPDCFTGGDSPIPASAPSGKPWSFFDPSKASPAVFSSQSCQITGASPQCNGNPRVFLPGSNIVTYKQVNVCRADVISAGGANSANCAVMPDGPPQQNANSAGNVACLNATLAPQLQGVWQNYKMIGSLWIRGQTGPQENFRIQVFEQPVSMPTPLPYKQAVGFPHLANTTMETFMQWGSTGYDPNTLLSGGQQPTVATTYGSNATQAGCFLCHNPPSTGTKGFSRTADLSHFPDRLGTGTLQAFRSRLVAANSSTPVDPKMLILPALPGQESAAQLRTRMAAHP